MRVPRCIAITGLRSFLGKRVLRRVREAAGDGVRLVGVDLQRPYGLDPAVRFHALDLAEPNADGRPWLSNWTKFRTTRVQEPVQQEAASVPRLLCRVSR